MIGTAIYPELRLRAKIQLFREALQVTGSFITETHEMGIILIENN